MAEKYGHGKDLDPRLPEAIFLFLDYWDALYRERKFEESDKVRAGLRYMGFDAKIDYDFELSKKLKVALVSLPKIPSIDWWNIDAWRKAQHFWDTRIGWDGEHWLG